MIAGNKGQQQWEIVKVAYGCNIHTPDSDCKYHGCGINSVKRLSDNEVFSVDEISKCQYGSSFKIRKFSIEVGDRMVIYCEGSSSPICALMDLIKIPPKPEPIFTANGDGIKIFEGQEYWFVDKTYNNKIFHNTAGLGLNAGGNAKCNIYFGNKSNAEAYLKSKQESKEWVKGMAEKMMSEPPTDRQEELLLNAIVEVLKKYDVRKYLNANNFGYSLVEREIANAVLRHYQQGTDEKLPQKEEQIKVAIDKTDSNYQVCVTANSPIPTSKFTAIKEAIESVLNETDLLTPQQMEMAILKIEKMQTPGSVSGFNASDFISSADKMARDAWNAARETDKPLGSYRYSTYEDYLIKKCFDQPLQFFNKVEEESSGLWLKWFERFFEIDSDSAEGTSELVKPPIGLKPMWLHNEERLDEIKAAIDRFKAAGKEIPDEWLTEQEWLRINVRPTDSSNPPSKIKTEDGFGVTPSERVWVVYNDHAVVEENLRWIPIRRKVSKIGTNTDSCKWFYDKENADNYCKIGTFKWTDALVREYMGTLLNGTFMDSEHFKKIKLGLC